MPEQPNQFQWQCPKCKTIISKDFLICSICELKKKSIIPKTFHIAKSIFSDEQKAIIKKKLPYLNPKEIQVIKMRTELNDIPPKSLRFIGEMLEMSQENVRLIEKKALAKIFNKKNIPVFSGKM